MLVAYVTGHGFGHATRTAEVLRQVRALHPGLPIQVVTAAPEWLFRVAIADPLVTTRLACDVGVAQHGALVLDEAATADAWERFQAANAARVEAEGGRLRAAGARLVLGDVPPLAFEAAHAAGVPAVALANFSWDWIWRHLARREPRLVAAADAAASAYAKADLLLQLPFAGDLRAFPVREEVPLVARRPSMASDEVRARLGLVTRDPVVLLSFGGIGLEGLDLRPLGRLSGYHFVAQDAVAPPANVTAFTNARLAGLGVLYQDLVGACDVVVSKPGYGIVTDCIGARTRLLYTDRGDFPEYPILVEEMRRYLPARHVSQEALFAGDLGGALGELLGERWPEAPALDGARVVARRLLELAGLGQGSDKGWFSAVK